MTTTVASPILTAGLALAIAIPAASQKSHVVDVNPDLTFSPAALTIEAGDSVTWTNRGGFHNVRADGGGFRCADGCDGAGGDGSPSDAGWSFTVTFDATGETPYHCEVHGAPGGVGMSGRITVIAGDDDDDDGGGDDDPSEPPDDPDPDDGDDGDDDSDGAPPPPAADDPPRPALPKRFVSGFEIAGFGDWSLRSCSSCQLVTGTVAGGGRALVHLPPDGGASRHRAWLLGPDGVDLDLVLARRAERGWVPVAAAAGAGAHERAEALSSRADHRWEIRSLADREVGFQLLFDHVATDETQLVQTSEARHLGHLGAAATYVAGSRHNDYLIDRLPAPAREYRASFNVQPLAELSLRGRRQQLLQLRDGDRPLVRLQLLSSTRPGIRIAASARIDGAWSSRGTVFLPQGEWKRVTLLWRAATSASSADGFVELRRGARVLWRLEGLEDPGQRVSEVWFGQITPGGPRAEGRLYLDDFVSDWSF